MTHLRHEKYGAVIGCIVFVISWIYCVMQYGYLFGVGLGWLPSLIVGFISFYVWPLIVSGIIVYLLFVLAISHNSLKGLLSELPVELFVIAGVSVIFYFFSSVASSFEGQKRTLCYWLMFLSILIFTSFLGASQDNEIKPLLTTTKTNHG